MATVTQGRGYAVQTSGFRELARELRAVDPKLPRELRVAGNEAAQLVVEEARSRGSRLGPVQRKAAESVRAGSDQRSAAVRLGGARYPFALGAEFGAYRDLQRRRRTGTYIGYRQFEPWRGSGRDSGYFLWPAIRGTRDEFLAAYEDALDRLLGHIFPEGLR